MAPHADELLREFALGNSLIALKVGSDELPGLFGKRLAVPHNAAALAMMEDGTPSIFSQGQDITGRFTAVVVKVGELRFTLQLNGLRSQDGFLADGRVGLGLSIDSSTIESFKNFARFMPSPMYRAKDLERYVVDRVRSACVDYVAGRPVKDIHRRDKTADLDRLIADKLQTHFLATGLLYEKLIAAEFVSKDYESQLVRVSQSNKDQQLKQDRLEKLAEFLKGREDVRNLIDRVQDPRLKSVLYTWMIAGGRPDDTTMGQALDEQALDQLHGAMQVLLAGEQVPVEDVLSEAAEKIFVTVGTRVVEIACEEPYAVRAIDLGEPLRSLRSVRYGERDLIVVGGKRTCTVLESDSETRRQFPLPDSKTPRGGVNAVAVYGNTLYATHSEYGLAIWDLREPNKPAEIVLENITSRNKTTRAVQVVKDNLVFASGASAYVLSLSNATSDPVEYRSSGGSLTALALASKQLFGATDDGRILQWDIAQPGRPTEHLRKSAPIFGLRLEKLRNVAHLIYSFNDTAIHARVMGQTLETAFEALGATFTSFDASSDLICAAMSRSSKLYLWKVTTPKRPTTIVDLSRFQDKEIMDVCLKKHLVLR